MLMLLLLLGAAAGVVLPVSGALAQTRPEDPLVINPDRPANADDAPVVIPHLITDMLVGLVGYPIAKIKLRDGKLHDQPDLARRLNSLLQPLDIVVVGNANHLSSMFIPGKFSHSTIWIGDERRLRAAGLWTRASVVPLHARIRAGQTVAEAASDGVRLFAMRELFDTDRIVVVRVRPGGQDPRQWRCRALDTIYRYLDAPYDFSFDTRTSQRVTCAELVMRSFAHVRWRTRTLFGRPTIVPDDLLRTALERRHGAHVVAYFKDGDDGGWRLAPPGELEADLR